MHGKFMIINCIYKVTNDQRAKPKEQYNSEIKLKNMVLDTIIEKMMILKKIIAKDFKLNDLKF